MGAQKLRGLGEEILDLAGVWEMRAARGMQVCGGDGECPTAGKTSGEVEGAGAGAPGTGKQEESRALWDAGGPMGPLCLPRSNEK